MSIAREAGGSLVPPAPHFDRILLAGRDVVLGTQGKPTGRDQMSFCHNYSSCFYLGTDSVGAGGLWNFSRDIHALTQSRYLALEMHFVVEHFNGPLKAVCLPIDCETNAHAILFI